MMTIKLIRIAIFMFFAIALYGSVNCLLDSERILEHNGAWISVYICTLACVFSVTIPIDLS